MDFYLDAKGSHAMTQLGADYTSALDDLTRYLGAGRPTPNAMVFFHDSTCSHCRVALPEYEQVARALDKSLISIGHMDCTKDKRVKEWLQLKGFPALFFSRARRPEGQQWDLESLKDRRVRVVEDKDFILRASRQAGIGTDQDAQRLKAAGLTLEVVKVDLFDQTAKLQVKTGSKGRTWFPLEALRLEDGSELPYLRAEAPVQYSGFWKSEEIHSFVKHMLQPLVARLDGPSLLDAATQGPSLVFCGPSLTTSFLEVATENQGLSHAYHAQEESVCPVKGRKHPLVVVHSAPKLQFSAHASKKLSKAAVVVAGPEVVEDGGAIVAWAKANRFPGFISLGRSNFYQFLRDAQDVAHRSFLVVALDLSERGKKEKSKQAAQSLVEKKLRNLVKPQDLGNNLEEFTYGPGDRFIGVIDGTENGIDDFGVYQQDLPRVLVFEGPDQWVEDLEELTVERLSTDLQKVDHMWRMSTSVKGKSLWFVRELLRRWLGLEDDFAGAVGYPGRIVLRAAAVLAPVLWIRYVWQGLRDLQVGAQDDLKVE